MFTSSNFVLCNVIFGGLISLDVIMFFLLKAWHICGQIQYGGMLQVEYCWNSFCAIVLVVLYLMDVCLLTF